jgi:hypothetical protein
MSLLQIIALFRRHKLAVALVLVLAVALLINIKKTPPTYQESATVIFTAPVSVANPNPYNSFNGDLTATGYVLMLQLKSPASRQEILNAGGSAPFDAGMVNLYNLEYPDYGDPYGIVTATSQDPVAAHRTFVAVTSELENLLAAHQTQAGVERRSWIGASLVGDSGPIVVPGSSKRVYAGVLVLTIVSTFAAATGLDRRRRRRRRGDRTGGAGGSGRRVSASAGRDRPVPARAQEPARQGSS